jgi:hypothetical protein
MQAGIQAFKSNKRVEMALQTRASHGGWVTGQGNMILDDMSHHLGVSTKSSILIHRK